MKFSNVLLFTILTFLTLDVFVYLVNPSSLPVFPVSSNFTNNLSDWSSDVCSSDLLIDKIIPQWFIAYILYPILLLFYLLTTLISIFIWAFNVIFMFNAYLPQILAMIIDFVFTAMLIISFITSIKIGGSGLE